ncbi:hypothetical protein BC835DRAFT_490310 [Cytidiella melzeri]|nr:hypothetical protein BC835DRAFT_490310 [Cytidiella melzeri]
MRGPQHNGLSSARTQCPSRVNQQLQPTMMYQRGLSTSCRHSNVREMKTKSPLPSTYIRLFNNDKQVLPKPTSTRTPYISLHHTYHHFHVSQPFQLTPQDKHNARYVYLAYHYAVPKHSRWSSSSYKSVPRKRSFTSGSLPSLPPPAEESTTTPRSRP